MHVVLYKRNALYAILKILILGQPVRMRPLWLLAYYRLKNYFNNFPFFKISPNSFWNWIALFRKAG